MKLLRTTIEYSNRVLGSLKARRRIGLDNAPETVKLNLGCGLAVSGDWINIDGSINALVASFPSFLRKTFYRLTGARQFYTEAQYLELLANHIFIHHDLAKSIPLENNTADFIYSSHFFEHLFLKDARHLLAECFRVLKPGGVLRFSVPDLDYAIGLYREGRKEDMLKNYFFVDRDDNFYSRHKYMYDFELLSGMLAETGFMEITRCHYQQGRVPDIEQLDNRPEDSLFVEAVKPE